MRIRGLPYILLLIALLSGSLIPGVSQVYAEDDDKDYLPPYLTEIERKPAKPRPDKALIYFVQTDSPIVGLSLWLNILLVPRKMWVFSDQQLLALMPASSVSYGYVDPGNHVFWVSHKTNENAVSALRMNVKAGKTYLFQLVGLSSKNTQLWVLDIQDLKPLVKKFQNIRVEHEHKKVNKFTKKIIAREYRNAIKAARTYPVSMVGSSPYDRSSRFSYKEKKFSYHFVTSNKKYAEPKSNKALIYIVSPPHYNKGMTVKKNSIWTFADKRLLGVTYLNDYAYAWVDPGEYLFWGVNYLRPGTKDFSISAIRMKVEAGKVYYLEQNIYTAGLSAMGLKLRVVEPAIGEKIVQRMKYFSVPTKKGLEKKGKVIDRYYDSAKRVKAAYPGTRYGRYSPQALDN